MTELAQPDERIAWLNWTHHTWGHEYPVSGDTLAQWKDASHNPYFDASAVEADKPYQILSLPRGYGKAYAQALRKAREEAEQSC